MTRENKNIAIAIAAGWSLDGISASNRGIIGVRPEGTEQSLEAVRMFLRPELDYIPEYFLDLAAMNVVEALIPDHRVGRWLEILQDIVYGVSPNSPRTVFACRGIVSASAEQRAEAFGQVMELWPPA